MNKSPSDLFDELQIARDLLEQERAAGHVSACANLLTIIGRLAKIYEEISVRANLMIGPQARAELGARLCEIVLGELQRYIPEGQQFDAANRIMDEILAITSAPPENTKEDIKYLLGRQR